MSEFLGREDGPRALVITGDPGIGKTTLWEAGVAAARERGFRVLVARPSEPEVQLSFAALADLLADVDRAEMAGVPSPQLNALEAALLRVDPGDASPPDPFAVSAGFTSALRALASRQQLLLAVDDAPWLDRSSTDVLAFAARRLREHSVRFLLTRRPRPPSSVEQALGSLGLDRLEVGPLSLGATRLLLSDRLGLRLPRRVLVRLFEASGGNPLFTLELGRVIAERGVPEAGVDLPLPDVVDDLFGARVGELPRPLRRLLLAVALSADLRTDQLVTIEDGAAIEEALDAGLLEVDGDRLRPSHPLLAAAVRSSSTELERRELHLLLARATVDDELRVRHLALATVGPDPELAASVASAAERAAARGARYEAVELAEHALRLTPESADERTGQLLGLARYLHAAGERERLAAVLDAGLEALPPGVARAESFLLLSESEAADSLDRLDHYLDLALAEAPEEGSIRASALAKKAAYTLASRVERLVEAERWAREALAAAASAGPDAERLALEALAWARAFGGRPLDDILRRFHALPNAVPVLADSPERPATMRHVWRGELDTARADLARLRAVTNERGDELSFTLLTFDLTDLELRAGRWDEATELLDDLADPDALATPAYEFSRALLAAGRGDPAEAESWADQTITRARAFAIRFDELVALWARGLAALLRGNPAQAAESLGVVWDHLQREQVEEPGAFPVAPDLVEALVELRDLDRARAVTERLQRLSEEQKHPWGLATAERCRGLIGLTSTHDDQAAAMLTAAAEEYGRLGLRFDQARSVLLLGRSQRRFKKWAAARQSLEQAVARFEDLGSPGWAEQARAELERVGARRPAPEGGLTVSETRVARLAAEGFSNKEIAAELFVTVHTVEKHLSRAYAKLGVKSRAKLAQRLPA